MENEIQSLGAAFAELTDGVRRAIGTLTLPSRINQIAIIVGCMVVAWILRRWLAPRFRNWLRGREGWPKARLRMLLNLHNRLQLMFFCALAWISVGVLAAVTRFPSHRYLVSLVATIATAWLFVGLAGRLIRTDLLRRIVTWGLWIYVTLYYIGISDEVQTFLDDVSVRFGDFRISALTVLKALVVTGVLVALARMVMRTASRKIRRNPDISPSMQELAVKGLQITLYGIGVLHRPQGRRL